MELSATSDVDLIFVYDYDEAVAQSDGSRPLSGTRYFARVAQRLIAALSAPTAEGHLYEVDMQLRPSGSSGPIATKIDGFQRYYAVDAWNWERMALTRARVIASSGQFSMSVDQAIDETLRQSRDRSALAQDVLDMRARLVREKGTDSCWDIKQVRGGLIDLEFTCQYLQLAFAADKPQILDQNTCVAFRNVMAADLIPRDLAKGLIEAADLMHSLTQVMRIAIDGKFRPEDAGEGLKTLMAAAGGAQDFAELEDRLIRAQQFVLEAFQDIVAVDV